jgi:hypothetical protein
MKQQPQRLWLLIVRDTEGEDTLFVTAPDARNVASFAAEAVAEIGERNLDSIQIIPADSAAFVKLAQQLHLKPRGRAGRNAA